MHPALTRIVAGAIARSVAARGKPRFAVYGWVVTPTLHQAFDATALTAQIAITTNAAAAGSESAAGAAGATVVLAVPHKPSPIGTQLLLQFAALPMEDLGITDHWGDYARFVVARSDDDASREVLNLAARTRGGDGDDDNVWLWVLPPHAKGANDAAILHGSAALSASGRLRQFVHVERKTWSPCLELDMRVPMLMNDMFFSDECKLIVFVQHAKRTSELFATLNAFATALKPHMRFYIGEPALCEAMLSEFGLRQDQARPARE